jgi:hypothetical protein
MMDGERSGGLPPVADTAAARNFLQSVFLYCWHYLPPSGAAEKRYATELQQDLPIACRSVKQVGVKVALKKFDLTAAISVGVTVIYLATGRIRTLPEFYVALAK